MVGTLILLSIVGDWNKELIFYQIHFILLYSIYFFFFAQIVKMMPKGQGTVLVLLGSL